MTPLPAVDWLGSAAAEWVDGFVRSGGMWHIITITSQVEVTTG